MQDSPLVQAFSTAGATAPPVDHTQTRIIMPQTFSAAPQPEVFENDHGNQCLRNFRVFKTGTFKDSFGFEATWETIHLDQMVGHYKLLRDGGNFPDVPVRSDHSFSVDKIVGYFMDLERQDEGDTSFLNATIEFTEPDAFAKWQRGTYRSRSLEVGMYESNTGSSYWPVVMGVAFVDIPAVEGLYARARAAVTSHRQDKETASVEEENTTTTTTPPAPPAAPPAAAPAAPAPAPVAFRVNGTETSDHSAVQTHIISLETALRTAADATREQFVDDMVKANKLAAPQRDSTVEFAKGLSNEQFAAWRTVTEGTTPNPTFAKQADGGGGTADPGGSALEGTEGADDQIAVLEETIANFRRMDWDEEKIAKTAPAKKLAALRAAK